MPTVYSTERQICSVLFLSMNCYNLNNDHLAERIIERHRMNVIREKRENNERMKLLNLICCYIPFLSLFIYFLFIYLVI